MIHVCGLFGTHKITVEELSRYGDIIAQREITVRIVNQSYRGDMCIDVPQNNTKYIKQNTNSVRISGWAVSGDSSATVRLKIDDKLEKNVLTRVKRPDVDQLVSPRFGGTNCTPNAGYNEMIDIRNWSIGTHKVTLEQVSRYGDIITSREINISIANQTYRGEVCIDTPTNNTNFIKPDVGKVRISGWAVSGDSGATVRMKIDGNIIKSNLARQKRPDVDSLVSPNYGGTNSTPNAGYSEIIDVSGWNFRNTLYSNRRGV